MDRDYLIKASMVYLFASSEKKNVEETFDIGDKIGSGATAVVRIVTHKVTKQTYAMKQIKRNVDTKTIRKEIDILLRLNHPNVIRLFEIFESERNVCLIMELVAGGELFDRIVERGFYSEQYAAQCVKQMLTAVQYLHHNHIVHRDLKPENLLYATESDDSLLKIADFGLSEIVPEGGTVQMICGTPGYCAPEVLLGKSYNCSVDMWAVGVILYIMLCGFEPFYDERGDEGMFQRILRCQFDFPSPWWDDISRNAIDLVRKLIVFDPSQRLSASEALQHPWMQGKDVRTVHLEATQQKLKEFNARRKMKAGVNAVMLATKLMKKVKVT